VGDVLRHRQPSPGFRRRVSVTKAGVSFALDHCATAVEGHPVDVAALRAARVSGSALYTGTMAMFVAAGFSELARTFPSRPVMRLSR